ncbi:MAG: 5'/3'-nucleotidase SurE [Actinomycetales bacterium]|nr:5'/3'-nucleotidase SurE [Actinomycetales bacterium]
MREPGPRERGDRDGPLRALVTNDDGVEAPGLRALAAAAVEHGYRVTVAAPRDESSGSSAALTAVVRRQRVVVTRRQVPGLDVDCVGVAASPGYIVVLATLGAFGPAPDLVLSGINRGANAGQAVLHSGTVGAVLTAASAGRRGMAVSVDVLSPAGATDTGEGRALAAVDASTDDLRNWETAADQARALFPALEAAPEGTVLNLNVPDRPAGRVRGLRRARLARFGQVQLAIAEVGEGFVRTVVEDAGSRREPGTDLAGLTSGYATVTALRAMVETDDVPLGDLAPELEG